MGRPRKSLSAAATTALSRAKETDVLRVAPDGDDKPEFVLTDAVIYEKDGVTIGNPLFVDRKEVGPMVVRGRLEVNVSDEDGRAEDITACLLRPASREPIDIEIPISNEYAIGYNKPGDGYKDIIPCLWVSGQAGWYEIRPSPLYEAMYLEICEAITIYYEALILHESYRIECNKYQAKLKKKSKSSPVPSPPTPPTERDVFFAYAAAAGDGVTEAETEARYVKWAFFLVRQLMKTEEFDWKDTPFSDWLHKRVAMLPRNSFPRAAPPPLHKARRAGGVFEDDSESDSEAPSEPSRSRRGRKPKATQNVSTASSSSHSLANLPIRKSRGDGIVESPVPIPQHYLAAQNPAPFVPSTSTDQSTVDVLLGVLDEIASEKNPMKVKPKTIHTQVYLKCRISNYNAPPEVMAFFSKELLPRLRSEWKGTPYHAWLLEASSGPLVLEHTTRQQLEHLQLVRRLKSAPRQTQPARITNEFFPSRASTSKSRLGEDSEDDAARLVAVGRGRGAGKNAGLRPRVSKKRLASELDLDSASDVSGRRGRKSAKMSHVPSEELEDHGMETSEQSDEESALDTDEESADVVFPDPPPPGSVRVVVRAERIPTMSPAGPNGTWACEEEGCNYVVREADGREGQRLIQEHFAQHEDRADRLKLAVEESRSRGHLPIDHLLEKIQAAGKRAIEKKNGQLNDQPLPAPIKRRLLF